jgi:hypothetical protein
MIGFVSSAAADVIPLEFMTEGKLRHVTLPTTVTVAAAETNVAAAILGLGLIQVPRYRVASDLADRRLVEVLGDFPPSPSLVFAVSAKSAILSAGAGFYRLAGRGICEPSAIGAVQWWLSYRESSAVRADCHQSGIRYHGDARFVTPKSFIKHFQSVARVSPGALVNGRAGGVSHDCHPTSIKALCQTSTEAVSGTISESCFPAHTMERPSEFHQNNRRCRPCCRIDVGFCG